MTSEQIHRALVVASIVYGAIVAILAVVGSDYLAGFAAIGAIVLGVLWAITGYLRNQRHDRSRG